MVHEQRSAAGKVELYASGSTGTSVVARIWRGQTKIDDADSYSRYLYEHGVLKIERMPGNRGVVMLRSNKNESVEFTVISIWQNRDAIEVWSGDDLRRTRHLERDPEFLLALPDRVELVDVLANDWDLFAPQTDPRSNRV
jgi:heme-degrading monooxygenase HmoA